MGIWSTSMKYHGNWRYDNVSRGGVKSQGKVVMQADVFGNTQVERDHACAQFCATVDNCQMWVQSLQNRMCYSVTAFESDGVANHFRGFVNQILDKMLRHQVNGVLEKMCRDATFLSAPAVQKFVPHIGVDGQGFVSLDVPSDFWNDVDLLANDTWSSLQFPVKHVNLSKIKAKDWRTSFLVNAVRDVLQHQYSGQALGEQFGTPMAFLVGGMLKSCVDNGGNCPKVPSDTESASVAGPIPPPHVLV